MTKIGEGKLPPEPSPVARSHKEIEQNASKFLNALESYHNANSDDRARLKGVMDQTLGLINSAVREIKQAGIYKQDVRVEKDYQTYINSHDPNDLAVLEEDLTTLRDYNKL
jgi:hypothetical protein